uniref:Disease resistance protein n=1 Tax=Davidia involucrata TaxID=16924 RepID=A0A5B7BF42_DAVIN
MALESLIGILGNIGGCIAAPIGRQFGYLIHYKRNIKNLRTEDDKLVALRDGKQQLVDAAKRNAEDILANVELWFTHVNAINEEAITILEAEATVNKGCLKGWCPNPKARHGLSRKAKKKIDF